ncbi:MAG: flavodoxin family protein [Clostridia bacterium]|nr:flavodoxin family protein [Clostridia bacterium]
MKVILVNGSPHQNGCTYTALTEVKRTLEKNGIETEEFWIGNKPISGCRGCGSCINTGRCFIDDKVNEFLKKVTNADGFIFGTPVHFASGSGAITSFMDRVFYGRRNLFKNKVAAGVVSCRRGGATSTFDQINKYFAMNNMPIVTSQYWNMVHGSKPDDVLKDEEGMQTMRTLGNNMAWLLKCIECGKNSGIKEPENEKIVATNFIR